MFSCHLALQTQLPEIRKLIVNIVLDRLLISGCDRCSLSVIVDKPSDPVDVLPHFGVDSREVRVCTADTPGDDALKFIIADERTTRITL